MVLQLIWPTKTDRRLGDVDVAKVLGDVVGDIVGVDNIAGDVARAAGDIVATYTTRRQDRGDVAGDI